MAWGYLPATILETRAACSALPRVAHMERKRGMDRGKEELLSIHKTTGLRQYLSSSRQWQWCVWFYPELSAWCEEHYHPVSSLLQLNRSRIGSPAWVSPRALFSGDQWVQRNHRTGSLVLPPAEASLLNCNGLHKRGWWMYMRHYTTVTCSLWIQPTGRIVKLTAGFFSTD